MKTKQFTIVVDGKEHEIAITVGSSAPEDIEADVFKECESAIRSAFTVKEKMYFLGRYIQGEAGGKDIMVRVGETLIPESHLAEHQASLKRMKEELAALGVIGNPIVHYQFFPVK